MLGCLSCGHLDPSKGKLLWTIDCEVVEVKIRIPKIFVTLRRLLTFLIFILSLIPNNALQIRGRGGCILASQHGQRKHVKRYHSVLSFFADTSHLVVWCGVGARSSARDLRGTR